MSDNKAASLPVRLLKGNKNSAWVVSLVCAWVGIFCCKTRALYCKKMTFRGDNFVLECRCSCRGIKCGFGSKPNCSTSNFMEIPFFTHLSPIPAAAHLGDLTKHAYETGFRERPKLPQKARVSRGGKGLVREAPAMFGANLLTRAVQNITIFLSSADRKCSACVSISKYQNRRNRKK